MRQRLARQAAEGFMNWGHFSFEERRAIETTLDVLDGLIVHLSAGEPVPNALLGDAVDVLRAVTYGRNPPGNERIESQQDVPQRAEVRALVGEMEWALESLARGEAGAAGAFVIQARTCIRLLRTQAALEATRQSSANDDTVSESRTDQPTIVTRSSMLRHVDHLLDAYARWKTTSHQRPTVTHD